MVEAMPAAMTAKTADPCESGPAMARGSELRQATTRAVTQALITAQAMPSGRYSARGPEKIRAAHEMLKVIVTRATTRPASRSDGRLWKLDAGARTGTAATGPAGTRGGMLTAAASLSAS